MKVNLLLLLLLLGWSFGMNAQDKAEKPYEGIFFMENQPWNDVLRKAKEQNRLIFVDCYTVWCGPCKGLSNDIFPQKKVGDFFNANFVNAKYDMEKGDGKMLYEKYKEHIIGFPTLLLIDTEGNVVHQMAGYQEADALIAGMKAGLEGKTLAAMEKKYNEGNRDFETVRDYVAALNGAFKREEIRRVVADYLTIIPVDSLLNKEIWGLVGEYVTDPYTEAYRSVFDHLEKYQYRLDVDRYKLERQLEGGMDKAVKGIIQVTTETTNADTLRMMRENADKLRQMLLKNTVKGFPTILCKLELNDLRLQGKASEMYQMLSIAEQLNLLPYELRFKGDCYVYIARNLDDREVLNSILAKLLAEQAEEDKADNALMRGNLYGVIAEVYVQLGQENKAAEAKMKGEQLEQAQKEIVNQWINETNEE